MELHISLSSVISRGDKGQTVRVVQQVLCHLEITVEVDGDFGEATEAAVKRFQATHGLKSDGDVGPKTLGKMLELLGHVTDEPTQTTAQVPVAPPHPACSVDSDLVAIRGQLAAKAAGQLIARGREVHGDGAWETTGTNSGPIVDEIRTANHCPTPAAWCGMFVGYCWMLAGIRASILRLAVFWSGPKLKLFFMHGKYVHWQKGQQPMDDWCTPHQFIEIGTVTGAARAALLDSWVPQPGDVIVFHADDSHVGMVAEYRPATREIVAREGNASNRGKSKVYGVDNPDITFLGRFNASDFEGEPDPDLVMTSACEIQADTPVQGESTR